MERVASPDTVRAPGLPGFQALARATVIATYLLIVLGAFTRISGSGMGCGTDWPLCNGQLFPPLQFEPIVEWSHRFVASIIGVLIVGTAVAASVFYRRVGLIFWPAWIAVGLVIVQVLLGMVTVRLDVPRPVVALHLAVALLTLANSTMVALVAAYYQEGSAREADLVEPQPKRFFGLAIWSAGLAFVVLVSGALVRATNTELACVEWPLCGALQASVTRFQAEIHMGHRYLTLIQMGLLLVCVVLAARAGRSMRKLRGHTFGMLALFLLQGLAGGVMVLTGLAAFWKMAHVALATLAWMGIVALPIVAYLRSPAGAARLTQS